MATVSFGRSAGGAMPMDELPVDELPVDDLIDFLLAFISVQDNPAGLAALGAAAMIEYLVPPFPGDTITLFGAVLITAYGWSFAAVLGVVMLGSLIGSMLVFHLGDRLRHRRLHGPDGWATLAWLVQRFRRHGAAWLVLNRFLPGIRSLFFVAAGMAGMRARAVLLYSALSALLWNLALIALGAALGANFDTLLHWVRSYNLGAGIVLGAIAALVIARMGWQRQRRKRARP